MTDAALGGRPAGRVARAAHRTEGPRSPNCSRRWQTAVGPAFRRLPADPVRGSLALPTPVARGRPVPLTLGLTPLIHSAPETPALRCPGAKQLSLAPSGEGTVLASNASAKPSEGGTNPLLPVLSGLPSLLVHLPQSKTLV